MKAIKNIRFFLSSERANIILFILEFENYTYTYTDTSPICGVSENKINKKICIYRDI